jgi:branched-chain amino acid transport system substrate-binding protein
MYGRCPFRARLKRLRLIVNEIKVGISVSLTGAYSVQGRESFRGVSLWTSDVNGEGGIYVREYGKKIPVELVHLDDKSSQQICRDNTRRLISKEKVDILLGPYSSSLTLAAAEAAEELGVTLWNHGGATDEIEERGFTCLVSAITPASRYAEGVIALLRAKDPQANKIASFLAEDSGFSRNIARGVRLYGEGNGFSVKEFKFISGNNDFSHLLEEAMDFSPDLILGMGRTHDDLALAGQIIEKKVRVKAIALVVASIKLFEETFHSNVEGFISCSQWEGGIKITPDIGPKPREFVTRFTSSYGIKPDYLAAQGYNIGLILQKCIGESGTPDGEALRGKAKSSQFKTFYGLFKVDGRGSQTGHEMVVVQWQNGKKVIVYPERCKEAGVRYPAEYAY